MKPPTPVDHVISQTLLHPRLPHLVVLIAEAEQLTVMDLNRGGKVVRVLGVKEAGDGRFVAGSFSKSGEYLYGVTEKAKIHIFSWNSGNLVRSIAAKDLKKSPSILKCHHKMDAFVLASPDDLAI